MFSLSLGVIKMRHRIFTLSPTIFLFVSGDFSSTLYTVIKILGVALRLSDRSRLIECNRINV